MTLRHGGKHKEKKTQKTQRKNNTKTTKKIYVENLAFGILCETL